MIVYNIPFSADESSLHNKIVKGLRLRLELCRSRRGNFDQRVDENEKRCSLYRKKNEKDTKKKATKKAGETEYSEVVVPYSYALMVSAHTYFTSVFLQKDPVFGVQGIQDEGQMKELAMETYLRYQYHSGDMGKHMLVWLLDPCRYGMGVLGEFWAENEKVVTQIVEEPVMQDGIAVEGKTQKVFKRQIVKGYVGNKVFNVHPKDFIFDPRIPMNAIQDMEFTGRTTTVSITAAMEREERGEYFNIDQVVKKVSTGVSDRDRQSDVDKVLDELTGASKVDKSNEILKTPVEGKTGNLELEEVSVTLIPNQWGISKSKRPEKWHFTLANKDTIICAYPQGTYHQEHPFHILEMELDGYSQDARSLMELTEPLNDVMSWMFNSHMWNKRASLNNQFVFDPNRVEERDVRSNKAGKMIRLKPTAYGSDVRSAITQLPVQDVTANSMQDAMLVEKLMQRQTGINEDVSGGSATSSRRSATEFNATTGFSMGRLAKDALHFSLTGMKSLGVHLISNSQQFYSDTQKMKVAGYTGVVEEVIEISPEAIAGRFDIVPIDGTMPVSRMQQAGFWKEVLVGMAQQPDLRAEYRFGDIFAHMARLSGMMNISKFRVEPDEKVKRLMEMGLIENVTAGNTPGTNQQVGTGNPGMGGAYDQLAVPQTPAGAVQPQQAPTQ